MKAKKTAIVTALLGIGVGAAGSVQAAPLQEVVQQTLTGNPEVSVAGNERLARDQQIQQARAGYYPTVDLNAGYGWEWTDSPTTRSANPPPGDGDEDLTRKETSLELRQMLFDGFATRSEVARQKARTASAAHVVSETAEKIALRTTEVNLELLKQQQLLALAEENLQAHKRIFDQIERRSQTGVSRMADLDQITGRLALAESNLVASRNNVTEADANYRRVVGDGPSDLSRPAEPGAALPATVDDAVAIALANHPTLKSAQADVDSAVAQHEASKHAFYPRFDLELARTWNDDLDGVPGRNEDAQAMIRMRWNLFNGQADSARKEETAHLINEAKDISANAMRQA
ncbi:MAG: TolC family outer membrane protein, partial [gamma proteobacterium symbiont of Phacoides pectinatus]